MNTCLCVAILDTFSEFWFNYSSDFGKVQFCPELSNFSWFSPITATRDDFWTLSGFNTDLIYHLLTCSTKI